MKKPLALVLASVAVLLLAAKELAATTITYSASGLLQDRSQPTGYSDRLVSGSLTIETQLELVLDYYHLKYWELTVNEFSLVIGSDVFSGTGSLLLHQPYFEDSALSLSGTGVFSSWSIGRPNSPDIYDWADAVVNRGDFTLPFTFIDHDPSWGGGSLSIVDSNGQNVYDHYVELHFAPVSRNVPEPSAMLLLGSGLLGLVGLHCRRKA